MKGAANELTSRLRSIDFFANLLSEREDGFDGEQKLALERVRAARNRMSERLGALIEYSIAMARDLDDVPIDPVRLARSVIDAHVAGGARAGLEAGDGGQPVAVRGDPKLLRLALGKMVAAARAQCGESAHPELGVITGPGSTRWLRFRIVHDGPPADPRGSMALATAQHIAERHGGHLSGGALTSGGAWMELALPRAGRRSRPCRPARHQAG